MEKCNYMQIYVIMCESDILHHWQQTLVLCNQISQNLYLCNWILVRLMCNSTAQPLLHSLCLRTSSFSQIPTSVHLSIYCTQYRKLESIIRSWTPLCNIGPIPSRPYLYITVNMDCLCECVNDWINEWMRSYWVICQKSAYKSMYAWMSKWVHESYGWVGWPKLMNDASDEQSGVTLKYVL